MKMRFYDYNRYKSICNLSSCVKHINICIQDLNTLLQRPQLQKTFKKGSLDKSVFEKVLT
jgi:hypothetical protein